MSSQFSQSKACQLLGSELVAVLRLGPIVASSLSRSAAAGEGGDVAGAVAGLLTAAHIRGLAVDAVVRVAVPPSRRGGLLQENPYIQAAATAAAAAAAAQKQKAAAAATAAGSSSSGSSGGGGGGGAADRDAFLPTHRVGRLRALMPKPGTDPARQTTAPADWLAAVDFGETVVPLALSAVSDDAMSEEEHRIYAQSTLGGAAGRGALLSGEQIEGARRRLRDLRTALILLLGPTGSGGGGGGGVGNADGVRQPVSDEELDDLRRRVLQLCEATTTTTAGAEAGRKRPRSGDDEPHKSPVSHTSSGSLAAAAAGGGDETAVELQRLRDLVARQGAQLQGLRRLSSAKEADLAEALKQQQLQEQQHAAEVDEMRGKMEEEARARERGEREAAAQLKERDATLQAVGAKLRTVAEKAAEYRKVYIEVVTNVLGYTPEEARTKKPDEVLALLKARKTL